MADSAHPYPEAPGGLTVAQVERAQLCDLLEAVGATAPTLCEGWTAHHLAAHLVLREGSPLDSARRFVQHSADQAVSEAVAARDLATLVTELRFGPPRFSLFAMPVADRLGNSLEFFVHHEDVRRAVPGTAPRELPRWAHDELWKVVAFAARASLRKSPVGLALRRRDTGELRVACKGDRTVVVEGLPGELALFVLGRGEAADVSFDGSPLAVEAVRGTRFSV